MPQAIPNTSVVTAADGRELAYIEVGDPHGPLIIHHHGGPGSRHEARLLAEVATHHGLRLVCVDRPGIGRSSPQPHRTYAGWVDDLIAVVDALGHHEFGVIGWSEGGPWALAAAALVDPVRLRHVTCVAPGSYGAFGDNSAAAHLSTVDAVGGTLALRFVPAFRVMYAAVGLTARRFPAAYLKQVRGAVDDYDRRVLADADVAAVFSEASTECFAQGSLGLVRDAEVLYRRWSFDVTQIDRPVHLWQGADDRLVPEPINRDLADRMPGTHWHLVDDAGHFLAVGGADEILAVAAAEMRER